jgi:ketosteroid isomerase-like protein
MDQVEIVRQAWEGLEHGDLDVIEAVLAPGAKWRGVEDGTWNCENRSMILNTLTRDVLDGYFVHLEDAFERSNRVVVAIRPDARRPSKWPLENGVRHLVVTMRDGTITEIKGCADRRAALDYADASYT